MNKGERIAIAIIGTTFVIAVQWLFALAGAPQQVWLFRDVFGVIQ